jgi:hypothetical protein
MLDSPLSAGPVEDITRIEFEPLGNGSFRWNLFAGSVRVHPEIGRRETLEMMVKTTVVLCTCPNAAIEESDGSSER